MKRNEILERQKKRSREDKTRREEGRGDESGYEKTGEGRKRKDRQLGIISQTHFTIGAWQTNEKLGFSFAWTSVRDSNQNKLLFSSDCFVSWHGFYFSFFREVPYFSKEGIEIYSLIQMHKFEIPVYLSGYTFAFFPRELGSFGETEKH